MRLASYDDGAGAPIVLIHAGGADSRMWAPQVPELVAAGYRVVRIDLPGFGASPVPTEPYDRAGVLVDALDNLDVGPAVVVGCSFGGLIAQLAVAAAPERAAGLMLVSSAFTDRGDEPALDDLERREDDLVAAGDLEAAAALNVDAWLGPEGGADARAALFEQFHDTFKNQAAVGPAAVAVPIPDVDPAAFAMPALLLTGGHDYPAITAAGRDHAARMPAARQAHLPWAGHLPSMERPAEFTALLLAFAAGTGLR
ncbi:MAG TPA: alpha/beta hydrolase [Streptosporangiaceae bacterium]|jgi:pimeloyl-ACP methyl ester carboxylesterase